MKSFQEGSRERYSCFSGFKRKAGTSSLTECVYNQTTGTARWTRPTLKCIREWLRPAGFEILSRQDSRTYIVNTPVCGLPGTVTQWVWSGREPTHSFEFKSRELRLGLLVHCLKPSDTNIVGTQRALGKGATLPTTGFVVGSKPAVLQGSHSKVFTAGFHRGVLIVGCSQQGAPSGIVTAGPLSRVLKAG